MAQWLGIRLVMVAVVTASGGWVAGISGCGRKSEPGTKKDGSYSRANLLQEAPQDLANPVVVDFDHRVRYLGNTVATGALSPGGQGQIVHYWQVLVPPGPGWKVFTHLSGDLGEQINLDASEMRSGYPPEKWKAGDVIRDEQWFTVPSQWQSERATLSVGLYQRGNQGVSARMPVSKGAADPERRAPVFEFSVAGSKNSVSGETTYLIPKASGAIEIDGFARESSWATAPLSPNFTDAEGGAMVGAATHARLLWDDKNLYVFVQVDDSDVYSPFNERDDTLWKADVIEVFVDADRNGRGYIELQVNPNNAHFDAWFPQTRREKHHFEWNSKMRSAVVVHGTAGARDDTDRGWDVEIAIPLADVRGMDTRMKVSLPPTLGDTWRLNIVRGEKRKDKGPAASSWNPITARDYHALDRMVTVVFANPNGTLHPTATPMERVNAKGERKTGAAILK